ncbi:MAG: CPBP family intramembrane metalloprotease [Anaerolineae bacterium]|nr:CPBP family intramembrane metalloprotease [Anaerolineae bacterium]
MNSISSIIKRHPLATFFILAYACSWWSVPFDGTQFAFGPLMAAIVVSGLIGGKVEFREWVRCCLRWRVGIGWYAVALLLPFGINATAAMLAVLLGAPFPSATQLSRWPELFIVFVLYLVAFGPLGEEPGWRGFAMPRLAARHSALVASLVLGLAVAIWHLPLVFVGKQPAVILGATFAAQIMYTWLTNHAHGSVLIVMVAHAVQGACGEYFGPMFSGAGATLQIWLLVAVQVAVALILAALTGPELAREPSPRVELVQVEPPLRPSPGRPEGH